MSAKRTAYKVLVERQEVERLIGRYRYRWEDIMIELTGI
jgi:hypothetical protein